MHSQTNKVILGSMLLLFSLPARWSPVAEADDKTSTVNDAAPTSVWSRCAVEGGQCNLAEPQVVRYGIEGAWVYGSFGGPTKCTNATFGDPKAGTRKECYVKARFPQDGWAPCAAEGGRCNFVGKAAVRYGAGNSWAYGTAKDGITCTNATFGDPAEGTQKACYFQQYEEVPQNGDGHGGGKR